MLDTTCLYNISVDTLVLTDTGVLNASAILYKILFWWLLHLIFSFVGQLQTLKHLHLCLLLRLLHHALHLGKSWESFLCLSFDFSKCLNKPVCWINKPRWISPILKLWMVLVEEFWGSLLQLVRFLLFLKKGSFSPFSSEQFITVVEMEWTSSLSPMKALFLVQHISWVSLPLMRCVCVCVWERERERESWWSYLAH